MLKSTSRDASALRALELVLVARDAGPAVGALEVVARGMRRALASSRPRPLACAANPICGTRMPEALVAPAQTQQRDLRRERQLVREARVPRHAPEDQAARGREQVRARLADSRVHGCRERAERTERQQDSARRRSRSSVERSAAAQPGSGSAPLRTGSGGRHRQHAQSRIRAELSASCASPP